MDFFIIVVTLFQISISQYSELMGHKILKFFRNRQTVSLHLVVLIWSRKAFAKDLFLKRDSFRANISLTLASRGKVIFWPVGWRVLEFLHSPYKIHVVTRLTRRPDFFFYAKMCMITSTFRFLMRDDIDIWRYFSVLSKKS